MTSTTLPNHKMSGQKWLVSLTPASASDRPSCSLALAREVIDLGAYRWSKPLEKLQRTFSFKKTAAPPKVMSLANSNPADDLTLLWTRTDDFSDRTANGFRMRSRSTAASGANELNLDSEFASSIKSA